MATRCPRSCHKLINYCNCIIINAKRFWNMKLRYMIHNLSTFLRIYNRIYYWYSLSGFLGLRSGISVTNIIIITKWAHLWTRGILENVFHYDIPLPKWWWQMKIESENESFYSLSWLDKNSHAKPRRPAGGTVTFSRI